MKKGLVVLVLALSVLGSGCKAIQPQEASVSPSVVTPIETQAGGDVWQAITQLQETMSCIEQNQVALGDEIADTIENVNKFVYDMSPNQLDLEKARIRESRLHNTQMMMALISFVILMAAVPGVFGAVKIPAVIASLVLMCLAAVMPVVVGFFGY